MIRQHPQAFTLGTGQHKAAAVAPHKHRDPGAGQVGKLGGQGVGSSLQLLAGKTVQGQAVVQDIVAPRQEILGRRHHQVPLIQASPGAPHVHQGSSAARLLFYPARHRLIAAAGTDNQVGPGRQ